VKPPIIDRADLQTWQHKTISGLLTLVFWTLWAYLWLPLLALIAWSVGLQQAYKYMVTLGGYEEVLRLLGIYTLVIVLMGGSLYAWAAYNILRYGGPDQRTTKPGPTVDEIARYFRQGPLMVENWQQSQRLHVRHDDTGNILHVDILADGAPVPEANPVPAASIAAALP